MVVDRYFLFQVETFVVDAKAKGANIVRGGNRHSLGGNFFEPTLITDVKSDMMVAKEEIFGPVAPVIKYVHTLMTVNPIGFFSYPIKSGSYFA